MAVTIQASIDSQEHGPNARRVYYAETENKWWVIYNDDGDIFFENSTDGTTWSNVTAVNTDAGATCDRPTLCSDGTYLYIFWADDGSGDDGIHFRRVTLSDSTLYPAANDGLVVDLGTFASIHQISAICTATSGVVWVSIPEEGSGPWYSDDNGANWSEAADADINTSDILTTLIALTGDKLMCIYDAGGGDDNDIKYKIYDAGWGVEDTVGDNLWDDDTDPIAAYRCNAVHIGSDKVIWTIIIPAVDGVASDIYVILYPGWGTQSFRLDNHYSWAISAWDETNSKLYLYYDSYDDGGNNNRPAYDVSSDEGANWDGETVIEDVEAIATSPSINANSAEKLGVTWVVGTTLYFEEIADLAPVGPNVNGVAFASIAKIDGIAAASIAKIDGVTF